MLDFLGNTASVLVTGILLIGFIAIAAIIIFEFGTMLTFWLKHSLSNTSGDKSPIAPRRRSMGRRLKRNFK